MIPVETGTKQTTTTTKKTKKKNQKKTYLFLNFFVVSVMSSSNRIQDHPLLECGRISFGVYKHNFQQVCYQCHFGQWLFSPHGLGILPNHHIHVTVSLIGNLLS